MFVGDPDGVIRTIVVGVLAYVALLALLRVSGKRTLSKLNAFDLIVTVALGSTLATILLSRDVPLLQGLAAFGVLVGLQFLITWTSVRWEKVAHVAKSEPRALLYRGRVLHEALREERVLEPELRASIREHGYARYEDVDLVVLETDGSLSAVGSLPDSVGDAVRGLGVPPHDNGGGGAR